MKIFNFDCTNKEISDKIIEGCNIGLIDPNNTKYKIFYNLYEQMIGNHWLPNEVSLSKDVIDFPNLSKIKQDGYSKTLAQLIFMDSIQTENTSGNVIPFISDPVAILALVRQSFEEGLHSDSYYTMADTVYENPEKIYSMWKIDPMLKKKNSYIGSVYEKYAYRANETKDIFILRTVFFWKIKELYNNNLEKMYKELLDYIIKGIKTIEKENIIITNKEIQKQKEEIRKEFYNELLGKKFNYLNKLFNKKIFDKNTFLNMFDNKQLKLLIEILTFVENEIKILEKFNKYEDYLNYEKYLRFESQVLMIIANQALEGIYFYSGFALIYLLGREGKMLGSTDMIRFINRDELMHTSLYRHLFLIIYKENKQLFNKDLIAKIREILKNAALLEIEWGKYILQDKILKNSIIENYIKYLANNRWEMLRLNKEYDYPFTEGPKRIPEAMKWVDAFRQIDSSKTNFFESAGKAYDSRGLNVNEISHSEELYNIASKPEKYQLLK